MAQYAPSDQNIQVTTGNVRTVLDVRDTTKPNNGAPNALGSSYYDNPTSTANPNGVPVKYRYVRYNSTANSAVKAAPGLVYWVDNTYTTVTSTMSEGITGTLNDVAGFMMVNSTDLTTLTATLLNGNFVWICVGGYVKAAIVAAATAVGDAEVGGGAAWVPVRVASGTAPTGRPAGFALTAISGSTADVYVTCESI